MEEWKEVLTSEELVAFKDSATEEIRRRCPNGSMEFKDLYGELDGDNLVLNLNATLVLPMNELERYILMCQEKNN